MSSLTPLLLVAGVVVSQLALFVAGYHLYVFTLPPDGGTVLQADDTGVFAASDRAGTPRLDDEAAERDRGDGNDEG